MKSKSVYAGSIAGPLPCSPGKKPSAVSGLKYLLSETDPGSRRRCSKPKQPLNGMGCAVGLQPVDL